MEKIFLDNQIVDILKVGLSGLAFLALVMSYYLLKSEQKRKENARENILKAIHKYTVVSIVFIVIVGGFSIAELFLFKENKVATHVDCQETIKRMVILSQSPNHDVESLRELIRNSASACSEINNE